jgi:hypothetical protein
MDQQPPSNPPSAHATHCREGGAAALLQQAGGLLAKGTALPPGLLETTRLKDANQVIMPSKP